MPATATILDTEGNKYWKDKTHRVFLDLATKPKAGKQRRIIGSTKNGILNIHRLGVWWMRNDGCWYVNVFLMQNAKFFNYNLVRIHGEKPDGELINGYFYPEYPLIKRGGLIHYRSYELQVEVRLEDVADTIEQAKRKLIELKAEMERNKNIPPPEPEITQGDLF